MKIISASTIRNHPQALPPQIKSLNYLNNILAKIDAIKAGTEEAIMLTYDDTIGLLPAWPKEWDVTFKLRAPKNTSVEGRVKHGEIVTLDITPEDRRKDVVVLSTQE